MAVTAKLHDVVDMLSDERKRIIYKLALDMLSAQQSEDFDHYSPEDIKAIEEASLRIDAGDCLTFDTAEEFSARFGT